MFVTGEKFSLTNINRIFFFILDIRLPSKYNIKWLTVVVGLRQMLCCFRKKKKKKKAALKCYESLYDMLGGAGSMRVFEERKSLGGN